MPTVYVIRYILSNPSGDNGEERISYYSESERQLFIETYTRLSSEWYVSNLRAYANHLNEIDVEKMRISL